MQAAGDLIAVVVELAAGVQHGQDHFRRRLAAFVVIDRNAAPVVDDRDRTVDVDGDVDLIAETSQRFIDRVVDDFVDEVMQTGRTRGADVYRRALADRFEALEDLDLVGAVVRDVLGVAVAVAGERPVIDGLSTGSASVCVSCERSMCSTVLLVPQVKQLAARRGDVRPASA